MVCQIGVVADELAPLLAQMTDILLPPARHPSTITYCTYIVSFVHVSGNLFSGRYDACTYFGFLGFC
jgi:hypothetical protein